MPKLQFLPSIRDSETISCPRCNTRQYPRNGTCIRCHAALGLGYVSLRIEDLFSAESEVSKEHLAHAIGTVLRSLRFRRGICQSRLARQADCINRTSLSKAECGRMLLPLDRLLPLAAALGLTTIILRFDDASTRTSNQSITARKSRGT